jgi:hypothetical protein
LEAMVVVDPPKNQGSLKENSGICEESIWGKDGNDAKVGSKARFLHPNTGFQDVSTSFNAAFWSRDVYKIIINYINVINWDTWMCVCVIHLWHFFLHLYSTVIHVCVCVSIIFSYSTVPWTRRGQESWEPKWLSGGFVGGFLVHLCRFARIDYVYPPVNRLQTNVYGHTHSW